MSELGHNKTIKMVTSSDKIIIPSLNHYYNTTNKANKF